MKEQNSKRIKSINYLNMVQRRCVAVDINADKIQSTNDEVYVWLAENAHRYGFTVLCVAIRHDFG